MVHLENRRIIVFLQLLRLLFKPFTAPDFNADSELTVIVVVAGLTRRFVKNNFFIRDCESERVVTGSESRISQVMCLPNCCPLSIARSLEFDFERSTRFDGRVLDDSILPYEGCAALCDNLKLGIGLLVRRAESLEISVFEANRGKAIIVFIINYYIATVFIFYIRVRAFQFK